MSLTNEQVKELADSLWSAEETHNFIPPLTDSYPELSPDDAYRIQEQVLQYRLSSGR